LGKGRSKGTSITDVARAAKVSTATVSYVLNGRGHVSEDTAERVRQAIRELNYQPNAAGRSLATDSARAIGLLAPSATAVSDPFFAMFLAGVLEGTRRHRYQLVLLSPEQAPGGTEAAIVRAVRSKRVDGVILLEVEPDDVRAQYMVDEGIPAVLFGRSLLPLAWVDVDNHLGGWMATKHLLELGHRRIAHIAAPGRYQYARLRRQGYEAALAEGQSGLVAQVVEGDLSVQSGYRLTRQLLTNGAPPTAIFAASDVMAEGAIRSALELGVRVPEQLSVVGFDDSPLAQDTFPPLTTVSQNAFQVGEHVADLLVQSLEEQSIEQVIVKPEMKVRNTTAALVGEVLVPAVGRGIVLKSGRAFAWLSSQGTIDPVAGIHGIYVSDTHWLNLYQVLVDGQHLFPLTTTVEDDGFTMKYVVQRNGGSQELSRSFRLYSDRFEDRWTWRCFGTTEAWTVELQAAPDFRDIFEIRGMATEQHAGIVSEWGAVERHRYHGRDQVDRSLTIEAQPDPDQGSAGHGRWQVGSTARAGTLTVRVSWRDNSLQIPPERETNRLPWPKVAIANPAWQRVVDRGQADLEMLLTDFGQGPVFAAGLPWYGTFFGRDAIISAYQVLPYVPEVSRRTLATLAFWQGREIAPEREEMPGKMVHEIRSGELTNLGILPYGRYYGSVDVTPLFLFLLVATWRRTGENQLVQQYLPVAERALAWMEAHGGRESDGLYHFNPKASGGLTVQSWKDSKDSMVYQDGSRANPPLAVAEVQGYVYAAKKAMAEWYRALGNQGAQERLETEAATLQQTFHQAFWMDDREYYAMAVDGAGNRLGVLSSDPGQCLWTEIVPEAYRSAVVRQLLSPELFSGWGIRTLGQNEVAYDPFSYHRGSVWPHDTGLVMAGLAKAGAFDAAYQVAQGLMDAAAESSLGRLPELFSGIERGETGVPVPYPSACAPQAWAAGSSWLTLSVLLGLEIDGIEQTVAVRALSAQVPDMRVEGIEVRGGLVAIEVREGVAQVTALPAGWRMKAAKEVVGRNSVSVPETQA